MKKKLKLYIHTSFIFYYPHFGSPAAIFVPQTSLGLWLCALNVEYRDFRYIIPFIVTFGIYLSPVGFVTPAFSEKWQLLYSLNPMVGVIDGFRWSLLRGELPLSVHELGVSVAGTLILCASGIWYFRKMEKTFADVI